MIPLNTPMTIRVYLRAKGVPTSTATFTGYIYGIPGSQFTKVIEFTNIGALSVIADNIIDVPLF